MKAEAENRVWKLAPGIVIRKNIGTVVSKKTTALSLTVQHDLSLYTEVTSSCWLYVFFTCVTVQLVPQSVSCPTMSHHHPRHPGFNTIHQAGILATLFRSNHQRPSNDKLDTRTILPKDYGDAVFLSKQWNHLPLPLPPLSAILSLCES